MAYLLQSKRSRTLESRSYLKLRYGLDSLAALLGLILLAIPAILIAIAIKMDGGPAIFTQRRVGLNGEEFEIFKFRTMIVDADRFLDERGVPTRKRTTGLGDYLRKLSLDEIPQLWNIVRGDMGVIGPRPILPRMAQFMTEHEKERFAIKPGLTGLAQIKGRNHLKWSRRLRYDRIYAERAGPVMDLWIVWRTVLQVISGSDIALDRNAERVDDVTNRTLIESGA